MKVESFYFDWFKDNHKMIECLKKIEKGELTPVEWSCEFSCDCSSTPTLDNELPLPPVCDNCRPTQNNIKNSHVCE